VHRLGEDAAGARLARTARPAKEVSVGDPALDDRVAEGAGDVLLADQLAKAPRAPLPIEDLIAHARPPTDCGLGIADCGLGATQSAIRNPQSAISGSSG